MDSGIVKGDQLYSRWLDEEIDLRIYYPPSFSPLYKYHILIAQDGDDYFNLGRIARTADTLINKKQMEHTIIIGIPYQDSQDRYHKYHPNGTKHQAYLRFLSRELVPYLDEKLPTYYMGMGRALIGDSLGATVSLLAALKYPHTFGKVIMQSPMVNDYVLEKTKNFLHPYLIDLYHVIGTKETYVKTTYGTESDFLSPNRELKNIIAHKGFEYFYDEFDGDHTWTYWQPDLKRALQLTLSS